MEHKLRKKIRKKLRFYNNVDSVWEKYTMDGAKRKVIRPNRSPVNHAVNAQTPVYKVRFIVFRDKTRD